MLLNRGVVITAGLMQMLIYCSQCKPQASTSSLSDTQFLDLLEEAPVNVVTTVTSCDDTLEGCVRPAAIPSDDECGTTNSIPPIKSHNRRNKRVVGGRETVRGQWPWLAAIGQVIDARFTPFCGGTLISKQHVLTAAQCFQRPKNNIIVRLGEYNTDEAQDGAQDFSIVDMRVGDYIQNKKENDITLLKLDRPLISYTTNIQAACLPYHLRDQTFEGNTPIVVGWGIFDNDIREHSKIPFQAPVPVVPIPECQQLYSFTEKTINNNQICAGRGIQDSCGGDSGGPLNYIDTQRFRFYVIGIVSFGPRLCGSQNIPGVYLRIGAYLDWIDENVKALS